VILGVSAFAVGGRLLAADDRGAWTRIDDSTLLVSKELGLAPDPATVADEAVRQRVAGRLAAVAADYILDAPRDDLGKALLLTDELPRKRRAGRHHVFGRRSRNISSATRRATTATSRDCSPPPSAASSSAAGRRSSSTRASVSARP